MENRHQNSSGEKKKTPAEKWSFWIIYIMLATFHLEAKNCFVGKHKSRFGKWEGGRGKKEGGWWG